MDDVAIDIRRQYPDSRLIVAGDLDAHGSGLQYAQAAATAGYPATIVMPAFSDERESGDFNDLHQTEGLEAVCDQICDELTATDLVVESSVGPVTSLRMESFAQPSLLKCDVRDGTHNTRPLTEFGNAQRLLDHNGNRLRYVYDVNKWIVWNGNAWQWDGSDSIVRSLATRLPEVIYAEGNGHLADAEFFAKWARQSQSEKVIRATVSIFKDIQQIRHSMAFIDTDLFTVGFDNASQVIDLKSGISRPATQDDYITKSLNVKSIGHADQATRWISFLDQIFDGDLELIDWIQRFCGYQRLRFPRQTGHRFHGKPITDSTANRPPGPAQTGQQFRLKLDSLKRPESA